MLSLLVAGLAPVIAFTATEIHHQPAMIDLGTTFVKKPCYLADWGKDSVGPNFPIPMDLSRN